VYKKGAIKALETIKSIINGHTTGEKSIDEYAVSVKPYLEAFSAEKAFNVASKLGATLLTPESEKWPNSLNSLAEFTPIMLYVLGGSNLASLSESSVSIVGARNCSEYGASIAYDFAYQVAERGYTVCSGGALGVDIKAHLGANAAKGGNVAFIASGVDKLTPSSNETILQNVIKAGGSVVSEYPVGARPTAFRYLERNRLIAAFSNATCLIEAEHRSGAISTANHANNLSRPVGAVPGRVDSATSVGCHTLIREARATLISSVDDLVELAQNSFEAPLVEREAGDGLDMRSGEVDVMRLFGKFRTLNAERVAKELVLPLSECTKVLVRLQLRGYIRSTTKGYIRVKNR
jgi:DNA protecting protein DprA